MDQNKSKSDLVVDALVKARNDKGLSQRDLAQALRVSQSKIASIENGKRTLTLDMAAMMARELEVDLAPLLSPFHQEQLQKYEDNSRRVIERFERLSYRDRNAVLALVRYLSSHPSEKEEFEVALSPDDAAVRKEESRQKEIEWRKRMVDKIKAKDPTANPDDYLPPISEED